MTLDERLLILQEQLTVMNKYREVCQKVGSTINYSGADFEREAMLERKIQETKDWMKGKRLKKK